MAKVNPGARLDNSPSIEGLFGLVVVSEAHALTDGKFQYLRYLTEGLSKYLLFIKKYVVLVMPISSFKKYGFAKNSLKQGVFAYDCDRFRKPFNAT